MTDIAMTTPSCAFVPAGPSAYGELRAAQIDPIDALLATDGLYTVSPAVAAEWRIEHLRKAVTHHRAHNPRFDRYCIRQGFDRQCISSESDLDHIPLLPTGVFKRHSDLALTRTKGPTAETTSSGTQGAISRVKRDDVTLMRFFASIAIANRELLGIEAFDRHIFNLGPPTHERPTLWISYVMAGVAVIFTTHCYVHNDRLDLDSLLDDLQSVSPNDGVTVVGPPPLLLDLANALQGRSPVTLGPRALVLTVGGWKRHVRDVVPRPEFEARIASALGIPESSGVRDTFNMVELNSVIFECAHKNKHCPPWLMASARDPRTLAPLGSGRSGILAFLDPTPASYPGFILSDDLGVVHRSRSCPCGIVGDVLVVERRVKNVDTRGCALKMETIEVESADPNGKNP